MRKLCSFVKEMCTNIDRGLCSELFSLGLHDIYWTRQITVIFKKKISVSCLFYTYDDFLSILHHIVNHFCFIKV